MRALTSAPCCQCYTLHSSSPIAWMHWLDLYKFKCAQLKFTVYGHKQLSKHAHILTQWSPASVGLAQTRPND